MPEVAKHPPGTFSWVDLTTPDSAASQAFYTALMGWEAIDIPAGEDFFYTLLSKNIKSVAGMAEMSPDDQPSGWKLYVAASDLDATVAKAAELGGTVLMPPMDVMTMVRIAMVQDPSGAMVALWQGLEFIGADLVREPGTLSWSELYTHDTAAAAAFYEDLFGWNSIEATTSDGGVAAANVSAETVTITAVGGGTATITVTARDSGGLAAMQSASVTVEGNQAPEAVGKIPDQALGVGQPSSRIDVSAYFRDPGDSLTYSAATSDREVATVSLAGSTLTVTAVGEGRSTITVTARDLQGLEAQQSFVATVVSNPDRAALVALYEAAGGDNWDRNDNWLTGAPLDDWYGVVANRTGRVVSLSLPINNLKGRLPPEIGDLSRLESLDLHRNWRPGPSSIGLTGRIPPEIARLSNLSDLNLSSNELTGPVPPDLGELANLVRLDVGWNDLTGRIPIELTELPFLAKLDLAHNNLTGPIHREIGAMATLTDLNLGGNGLSGGIPRELGNLSLTLLDLGFNNLTGSIPPELGDITTLLTLVLWNNRLTGPIPEELGNLGRLLNLMLNDNLLTGPVPESLLQLRLFSFRAANNTSVCVPDTPEFAAWVNSLTQYDEPPFCTGR